MTFPRHYADHITVSAFPETLFAFVDDHHNFSAHMNQSSWMMAGSKMSTKIDNQQGRRVGSHIHMSGRILGLPVRLDEVITVHNPPRQKTWETVGDVRLLVIGPYRMDVQIGRQGEGSQLTIAIDYQLPDKNIWLGKLLGDFYARWCVRQMLDTVRRRFSGTSGT